MLYVLIGAVLLGCRSTPQEEASDTAALTEIGDTEAMAAAWCAVLSCRDGFYDEFASVDECTELYSHYWGDETWSNNQRACFEDVEGTAACTAALEATACGGETPEACRALLDCTTSADTGR